jgi:hypothetical protein
MGVLNIKNTPIIHTKVPKLPADYCTGCRWREKPEYVKELNKENKRRLPEKRTEKHRQCLFTGDGTLPENGRMWRGSLEM